MASRRGCHSDHRQYALAMACGRCERPLSADCFAIACQAMDVLDILVQSPRNKAAAKRFLLKLLKRWRAPRVMETDKLRSYGAAKMEILPGLEHRQHKGLNNRSEASHRHTRRREKMIGCFKSPRQAQRFLSAHDQIACLFHPKRHRLPATSYRHARNDAFDLWVNYAAELAN